MDKTDTEFVVPHFMMESVREVEASSLTPFCSATACRACSRWPRADASGVQWFVCCIVRGVPLCPLVSSVSW